MTDPKHHDDADRTKSHEEPMVLAKNIKLGKHRRNDPPASAWRRASDAIATIFKNHQRPNLINSMRDEQPVEQGSGSGYVPPNTVGQDPKNPNREPRNPNRPVKINHERTLRGLENLTLAENSSENDNTSLKMPDGISATSSSSERRPTSSKESTRVVTRAGLAQELKNLETSKVKTDGIKGADKTIAKTFMRNYNCELERELRSISHKPSPNVKSRLEPNKNLLPVTLVNAGGALGIGGLRAADKNNIARHDDKSDKPQDPSAKSMRQLYSMADSWSTDSVVSHSESCPCCHNNEPCPIHRKPNTELSK